MTTLHLLGGARLETGEGRLQGEAVQRHRLALLALLALSREQRMPRERLLALLWPEQGSKQARDLLNAAVYVLRRWIGRDAIRSEGDDLRLDPGHLACDVTDFLRAIEEGDLERAETLYAGPFMDGFFLDGARDFEQWQDELRTEIENAYGDALSALVDAADEEDRRDEAIRRLRKLVRHRRTDAQAAMRLMRLLVAEGDRTGALAVSRQHARALEALYEAEPNPEVEDLARRIRDNPEALQPRDARTAEPRAGPRSSDTDPSSSAPSAPPLPHVVPEGEDAGPSVDETSASPSRVAALFALAAVAAVVIAPAGLLVRSPSADVAVDEGPRAPSVAVRPFVDLSPGGDFAYFGDGLTDEVLNALARMPGLAVAARSSAFQFRGDSVDSREVGRALGVGSVVEGSIRVDGDRLRVTAQLIDARTGYNLWTDQYDRRFGDVLTVQEEIAEALASALSHHFDVPLADPAPSMRTADPEAYRLYLFGRHQWRLRTEEGMRAALEAFRQAVAIDADFAAAHAGLADVWQLLPDYADVESAEGLARARTHALRAVALDSTLAEAQVALAALLADYDRDRAAAERTFRRALRQNPNYVTGRHWLALYLADSGRHEEALEEIERARRLDPLSDIVNTAVGAIRYFARDYHGAQAEYRAVLDLRPDFALGWALLGRVQLVAGDVDAAVESLERSVDLSARDPSYLAVYAAALAEAGRVDEAWDLAEELMARHPDGYVPYCELASAFIRLGDLERALTLFELALPAYDPALTHIDVEPLYDAVRDEPRFREVVRTMGLEGGLPR